MENKQMRLTKTLAGVKYDIDYSFDSEADKWWLTVVNMQTGSVEICKASCRSFWDEFQLEQEVRWQLGLDYYAYEMVFTGKGGFGWVYKHQSSN